MSAESGRMATLTCPTCPMGMNVQILPEGERMCRTCGTKWGRQTTCTCIPASEVETDADGLLVLPVCPIHSLTTPVGRQTTPVRPRCRIPAPPGRGQCQQAEGHEPPCDWYDPADWKTTPPVATGANALPHRVTSATGANAEPTRPTHAEMWCRDHQRLRARCDELGSTHVVWRSEADRLIAEAQAEAEKHQPEAKGCGCTCGFCAWSVEHVLVMSMREVLR